mgnify:CR=1 FL=1
MITQVSALEEQKQHIRQLASKLNLFVNRQLQIYDQQRLVHQSTSIEDLHQTLTELYNNKITSTKSVDYKFKMEPYEHQKVGFFLTNEEPVFALSMEMQTGKTKLALDSAFYMYQKGYIDSLLIIAPNMVHMKWVLDEIPEQIPDTMGYSQYVWQSKKTKTEERAKTEFLTQKSFGIKIMSISYDGLNTDRGFEFVNKFIDSHNCFCALDESHFIKEPTSKRSKKILAISKKLKYKRTLTGTPVTQNTLDIWAQYTFLDPSILRNMSYYSFKNRYVVNERKEVYVKTKDGDKTSRMMDNITGYKNLDELQGLIEPYTYRVLKSQCLDLPDKIYRKEVVNLTPQQKKLYDEMAINLFTVHEGQAMSASIVLTKYLRLQQIIGGFWTPDDTEEAKAIEGTNPKIERFLTMVNEIDPSSQVIVWSRFTKEIELIYDRLIKKYGEESTVLYYGAVKKDKKQESLDRFKSGKARFFVGNQRAGGTGLSLHNANYMFYFSNDFALATRLQSEDRIHGIGQKKNACYIDLVAEETLDDKVLGALRSKKELADLITQDYKYLLK